MGTESLPLNKDILRHHLAIASAHRAGDEREEVNGSKREIEEKKREEMNKKG